MPSALPLTNLISQGSTRKRMNRVLMAQFGDGYEQTFPEGINNLVDLWDIRYDNLTTAERDTLTAVLDAVGGWDYLTWAPPGGTSKKWKLTKEGWSETAQSGEYYSITFSLRQVF